MAFIRRSAATAATTSDALALTNQSSAVVVGVPSNRRDAFASMFQEMVGSISAVVRDSAASSMEQLASTHLRTYDGRPGFKVIFEVVGEPRVLSGPAKRGKYTIQYVSGRVLRLSDLTADCTASTSSPDGTITSCTYNAYLNKGGTPYKTQVLIGGRLQRFVIKAFLVASDKDPTAPSSGQIVCLSKVRATAHLKKGSVPLLALLVLVNDGYGLTPADGLPPIPEDRIWDVMSDETGPYAIKREQAAMHAMTLYNSFHPEAPYDDVYKFLALAQPTEPWGPDGPTIAPVSSYIKSEADAANNVKPTGLAYTKDLADGRFASVANITLVATELECSAGDVHILPRTHRVADMYKAGFVATNGPDSIVLEAGLPANTNRFVSLTSSTDPTLEYHCKFNETGRESQLSTFWTATAHAHKIAQEVKADDKPSVYKPMLGLCIVQTRLIIDPAKGRKVDKISIGAGLVETRPNTELALPVPSAPNNDLWCKSPFAADFASHIQGTFILTLNPAENVPTSYDAMTTVAQNAAAATQALVGENVQTETFIVVGSITPVYIDTASTLVSVCGGHVVTEEQLAKIPNSVFPANNSNPPPVHVCNGVTHVTYKRSVSPDKPIVVVYYHPDESVAFDPDTPPPMIPYRGLAAIEKIAELESTKRPMSSKTFYVFNLPDTPEVMFRLGMGPDPKLAETSGVTGSSGSSDAVYRMIDNVLALPAPSDASSTADGVAAAAAVAQIGTKRSRDDASLDDEHGGELGEADKKKKSSSSAAAKKAKTVAAAGAGASSAPMTDVVE